MLRKSLLLKLFIVLGYVNVSFTQNASIATWKNNAKGCYNLIHDDYGAAVVDGIWRYADTICHNRGITFTFGAITSECEATRNVNGYNSPYDYAKNVMMGQHGHEIMNHSHTHDCAVPTTWSPCDITNGWGMEPGSFNFNRQLETSTNSIETNTGHRPKYFIYPFDRFSNEANDKLKELGYIGSRTGFSAQAGGTSFYREGYDRHDLSDFYPDSDGFFRTAVVVKASDLGTGIVTANEMDYWAQYAADNGVWVNREMHNVGSSGWGSITVDNYRDHIDFLKQKVDNNELWISTISEILTYQIQKLNYTPNTNYLSADNEINVSWNSPSFDVESYLAKLDLKSPVTVNVNVSQLGTTQDLVVKQNGITIPHTINGLTLSVNVYPHIGSFNISTFSQPCLTVCIEGELETTKSSVDEGDSFTLTVGATGVGNLNYAWYQNGNLIPAASQNTYTVSNASDSDAGNYYVVVSNGTDTEISRTISVSVNAQSPYEGVAASIPGRLEVERYDSGGEGMSYYEINQTWEPSDEGFRSDGILDVDESPTSDPSNIGGYHIGYTSAGEWLEYTVNVQQAGDYDISLRVATNDGDKTLKLQTENNVDLIDLLPIPNTGGWSSWRTLEVTGVTLAEGIQVLKLTWPEGNVDINYIDFALVSSNPAVADFSVNSSNVCVGEDLVFTNESSNASTFTWDFGSDAVPSSASGAGPHVVKYTSGGQKTVSLDVGDDVEVKTNFVTVNVVPIINTATPPAQCEGTVDLTNYVSKQSSTSLEFYSDSQLNNSISDQVSTSGIYYVLGTENNCESEVAEIDIQIDQKPSNISAGNDVTVCESSTSLSAQNPTNGSGTWSKVSGTGFISSASGTTVNLEGLQESQNITLRWTVSNGGSCAAEFDEVSVSRSASLSPSVNLIVNNDEICESGNVSLTLNHNLSSPSIAWFKDGTPISGASNTLNTIVNSSSVFSAELTYLECGISKVAESNSADVTVFQAPVANAGPDVEVCGTTASVKAINPNNGSGSWSKVSGTGTISSFNGLTANLVGLQYGKSLTLRWLVAGDGTCSSVSDEVIITRSTSITPNVSLSVDKSKVCEGQTATVSLTHNLSNPAIVWKKNGIIAPGSGLNLPVLVNTSITVFAEVSYDECGTNKSVNTSSLLIESYSSPSVNAGSNSSICETSNVSLIGNSSENTVQWSTNGSGNIASSSSKNTTYVPSSSDKVAGIVLFTLTASNPVCGSVSSTKQVTIERVPQVNAGGNGVTCENETIGLVGTTSGSSSEWSTTGSGGLSNANSSVTSYSLSNQDIINGSVLFIFTGNSQLCGSRSSTKVVTINPAVSVDAGDDFSACARSSETITLDGSSSTNFVSWSSTTGGFFDNRNALNAIYTLSDTDIANGQVSLILTADGGGCSDVSSSVNVNLDICSGVDSYFESNEVTAYPNPFTDILTVDNLSGETLSYTLFTVAGDIIKSGYLGGSSSIETDNLAVGVYFLKVSGDDRIQTIRVVKK